MENTNNSFIWRTLQQYSAFTVKFLVQIILTRLLLPSDFGLIAIVIVFVNLTEILAISGMGTALVQCKCPDEKDYGTVLTYSIVLGAFLYVAIFFSAPIISTYYGISEIKGVLRVYGISMFIQAYIAVENAYVQKNFEFRKSFFATSIAVTISGSVAVYLAYKQYGVWALVIQSLLMNVLYLVALRLLTKWSPHLYFEVHKFKKLFGFSWKILIATLSGYIIEDLYNLTIGKYYNNTTLGYYNRGNMFPAAFLGQTRIAIVAVLLPYYAKAQDDINYVTLVRKMTHLMCVLLFPSACIIAVSARSIVSVFLTDKWLPCVFFMRLECAFYACLSIATSLSNAIIAKGRSDISMYVEATKLCMAIVCVAFLHGFDVKILCVARTAIAVIITFYSVIITKKLIGYSFKALLEDIWRPLLLSLFMGAIVYCVELIGLKDIYTLMLQTITGFCVYIAGIYLFMKQDFNLLRKLCFQMIGKATA